jgi:hypothetical protein
MSEKSKKKNATGDGDLGEQWAFKTIFQKALLRLGKQLELSLTTEEKKRMGTVTDLLSFLDRLYQRNVLRVFYPLRGHSHLFWTFIALNYGNRKIKVSTQTEKRIEDFLRLAYIGWRFANHSGLSISELPSDSCITPRALFKEISLKTSHTLWGGYEAANTMLELMADSATIISPALGEAEANGTIEMPDLDRDKKKIGRDRVISLLTECWIDGADFSLSEAHQSEDQDDGMI